MDNYNPNIHHRKSIRLQGYDYSKSGLYFITICVQDRKCLFGNIVQENNVAQIILNDAGKIAEKCWLEIPEHFPNAVLHEHIIMPNHVHGIIELVKKVGVQNFEPLHQINKFQKIIPQSIGSIVRGYKIGVTKWFRSNTDIEFVWQRNYYENIIRTEKSCQRLREYILKNAKNWFEDDFFS
jgi:REP element-mobilizing transposase RayT